MGKILFTGEGQSVILISILEKMKIEVNGYTYQYDGKKKVKVGDKAILPTPSFLRDIKGPTWKGVVTKLNSNYSGRCQNVIEIKGSRKKKVKNKTEIER